HRTSGCRPGRGRAAAGGNVLGVAVPRCARRPGTSRRGDLADRPPRGLTVEAGQGRADRWDPVRRAVEPRVDTVTGASEAVDGPGRAGRDIAGHPPADPADRGVRAGAGRASAVVRPGPGRSRWSPVP